MANPSTNAPETPEQPATALPVDAELPKPEPRTQWVGNEAERARERVQRAASEEARQLAGR